MLSRFWVQMRLAIDVFTMMTTGFVKWKKYAHDNFVILITNLHFQTKRDVRYTPKYISVSITATIYLFQKITLVEYYNDNIMIGGHHGSQTSYDDFFKSLRLPRNIWNRELMYGLKG